MNIDNSYLSKVIQGKRAPSLAFYKDLSEVFDEPLGKILMLDGVLPENEDEEGLELTLRQLIEIGKQLSYEERLEVLNYADYVANREKQKKR